MLLYSIEYQWDVLTKLWCIFAIMEFILENTSPNILPNMPWGANWRLFWWWALPAPCSIAGRLVWNPKFPNGSSNPPNIDDIWSRWSLKDKVHWACKINKHRSIGHRTIILSKNNNNYSFDWEVPSLTRNANWTFCYYVKYQNLYNFSKPNMKVDF